MSEQRWQTLLLFAVLMLQVGWMWHRENQWGRIQDNNSAILDISRRQEQLHLGFIKHMANSKNACEKDYGNN